MTIADKLRQLINIKGELKSAINAKGGNVEDTTPFADYSTQIANLPSGGDGGSSVSSNDILRKILIFN